MFRLVAAFALAPLTPWLLFIAPALMGLVATTDLGPVMMLTFSAYLATCIFGVPAYLMFRHRRWFDLRRVMLGGASIGALYAALNVVFLLGLAALMQLSASELSQTDAPFGIAVLAAASVAVGTLWGATAGLCFWAIAMRPNGSSPTDPQEVLR